MEITKKHISRFLIVFAFLYLATIIVSYLFNSYLPNFDEKIVDEFKNDNNLIKEIGSYKNHEFSYLNSELSSDSLHFELVIFGDKKSIIYTGCAIKNEKDNWEIKRIESKVE
jgi:hypothetical protein